MPDVTRDSATHRPGERTTSPCYDGRQLAAQTAARKHRIPMKKRTTPSAEGALDKLSRNITEAADSFIEVLRSSLESIKHSARIGTPAEARTHSSVRAAGRGARVRKASVKNRWPWDQILSAAQRLLKEDFGKRWTALLPRLREMGLIGGTGARAFRATGGKAPDAEKPATHNVTAVRRARNKGKPVAVKPAKTRKAVTVSKRRSALEGKAADGSDAKLIAASRTLLDADSFRVWRAREFIHALKYVGVSLPSWRGVHLKLLPRLRAQKMIKDEGAGFRAAVKTEPSAGTRV